MGDDPGETQTLESIYLGRTLTVSAPLPDAGDFDIETISPTPAPVVSVLEDDRYLGVFQGMGVALRSCGVGGRLRPEVLGFVTVRSVGVAFTPGCSDGV